MRWSGLTIRLKARQLSRAQREELGIEGDAPRQGTRYHAKFTSYNGHTYHSKAEAEHAMALDAMVRAGTVRQWRRQVAFDLIVAGVWIETYRIDFEVDYADGRTVLEEIKGAPAREWKIKDRLFRALYPDRAYTVLYVGRNRSRRARGA